MTTLAPSFLNLAGNKDFHQSLKSLIFRHIHPPAKELASLERKNITV